MYCKPRLFFFSLWLTKNVSLANSGQAVSPPSHPRRARSGQGGCDGPGSTGPASTEAHTAVRCLTRAWMLHPACCHPAKPCPQPKPTTFLQGPESPTPLLGVRTQWAVGFWESASAWLREETGGWDTSVSPYDVSCHPLPVHHISISILF